MSKVLGRNIVITFGDTPVEKGIYDFDLDEKSDEIDVTDTLSPEGVKEYVTGLVSSTFTFGMWFRDNETPFALNSKHPFVITLGRSTLSGVLEISRRRMVTKMEDAVKMTFTARICGNLFHAILPAEVPDGGN